MQQLERTQQYEVKQQAKQQAKQAKCQKQKDQKLQDVDKDTFVKRMIDQPNGKIKLVYNTENWYDSLCSPETKRKEILSRYHSQSHRGKKASKRYPMHRRYWPDRASEITEYLRSREACGLAKSGRQPHASLAEFLAELKRFLTVHIDILRMDQPIKRRKNVLTRIDRTTCWPEAIPIERTYAEMVA